MHREPTREEMDFMEEWYGVESEDELEEYLEDCWGNYDD